MGGDKPKAKPKPVKKPAKKPAKKPPKKPAKKAKPPKPPKPRKYEDRYKTEIVSFTERVKNIARHHFRGIIGFLVPLCVLSHTGDRTDRAKTVGIVWMWMLWSFIWQPINVPPIGMAPMIIFPMTGVMDSDKACICYFNDGIALFIIGSMLNLILNNSGFDRRIVVWLLCQGDACQFSPKRLIFKASTAAFFLSMFSNRLIISSMLIQYMTSAINDVHKWAGNRGANYPEISRIMCNAIQTSSAIGSFAIVHSSNSVLAARAIFCCIDQKHDTYFNYLQYSAFAFPCAFVMFIVNFSYHMVLINTLAPKVMEGSSKVRLRSIMLNFRSAITKDPSFHEQQSVFFMVVALILFFTRKNEWMEGWAKFRDIDDLETFISDTTIAAAFVILLHMVPNRYQFLNYVTAEKKSQLPLKKASSSLLWWKFIDQHTNYSYFLLLGGGIALYRAIEISGLKDAVGGESSNATKLPGSSWNLATFLLCLFPAIASNIMTSVAACIMLLPYLTYTVGSGVWASNQHLICAVVGIACNFGFAAHYLFTPAYYCHTTGKVSVKKMCIYNIPIIVILVIILWIFVMFWAPIIWTPATPPAPPPAAAAAPTEAAPSEAPPPAPAD